MRAASLLGGLAFINTQAFRIAFIGAESATLRAPLQHAGFFPDFLGEKIVERRPQRGYGRKLLNVIRTSV
jgi:hypothetical protein